MSRRTTVLACLVITTLSTLLVAAPAQAATSYSTTDYVALGDSYSSGVGAPGQSGLCLRGSSGYPAQWARRNSPASYRNLACGGAVTSDVQNFQVPFLSSRTDLVSITIGGNDAGFAPAVITCTLSSDAGCAAVVATAHDYVRDVLPAKLDATYRAIRRHAPNAVVVVLSYPILFDTTTAGCGVGGMSLAKRRALNSGAQDLADLIKDRAAAAGFRFADVRDSFTGHGICGPSPWLNGLTVIPPTDSFHPNANGYTYGYLPALTAALN
jgi:lysophospholipase L1-like esterase